jgi:hypothetical protein
MAIYGLEEVEALVVDRLLSARIPLVPCLND